MREKDDASNEVVSSSAGWDDIASFLFLIRSYLIKTVKKLHEIIVGAILMVSLELDSAKRRATASSEGKEAINH